jgi:cyclopropane fatty-acyl-phospholipid synthase-like methyltransferase
MKNQYKEYFKNHYKSTFTIKDIEDYQKWFTAQWNFINKHIIIEKEEKILEIGSGVGGLYAFLKGKEIDYIGLEPDKQAMKFANSFFKKNIFHSIFLENLPIREKYNKIFAFEVLEHLENPTASINKIHQLLNTNGIFCGTTPYPYYKNIVADKTHISVLHTENWKRLFVQEGFQSVDLFPMSFVPYIWRINKQYNIRLPFYIPFNGFISTCLIIAKK